jgi:hypothetical protein
MAALTIAIATSPYSATIIEAWSKAAKHGSLEPLAALHPRRKSETRV